MTLEVHFGFNEKGEPVSIPLFQMFFDATTGHGKTVGMKSLLWRFHETHPDWKILIIDSKDKRDYADLNTDIPICFVETTEPLDLKNLLEPLVGASLMYYLDKIIEEAIFDTLGEMQENIEKKIVEADKGKIKIHGKELGKLRVLNHLLKKLIVLVDRPEITDELILRPGINVMPVSLPGVPTRLKRAYQWLIVRSVMLKLTEPQYEKVLVVLDEFHKWSPQKWASIVKQLISDNVSEGRGKEIFYWMADQALAKVDKEPLKPVKVWIVGQQLGRHEVKYAVETANDMTELTVDKKDIKKLNVGHFIVVDGVNHRVEKAYLQPCGVPDELAKQIATNQRSPSDADPYISQFKFVSRLREDEDLLYKEKFEEEKRKREQLEKALAKFKEGLLDNYIEKDQHTKIIGELINEHGKEVAKLQKELKPLKEFRDAFLKVLPSPPIKEPTFSHPGEISEISVKHEIPTLNLQVVRKKLETNTEDLQGRIALVYAEGLLPSKKAFSVRQLNKIMEQRFGRKEAYANFPKVLTDFVTWGFFEKVKAGKRWDYRIKISSEEAKQRGLLKISEVNA